jgi:endonuclease-3
MRLNNNYKKILNIFNKLYPDPKSELNFKNEYQLVIAVVLSAQCTDKKVNEVTPILFKEYKNFKELSKAKLSAVEQIIRPINYYKTKSKNIIKLSQMACDEYNAELPKNLEQLVSLPGVGRKTASVILCELNIAPAFPVDTHVFRVSQRLGLASGKNPVELEKSIRNNFKPTIWRNLHHWLIFHGRRVCKAQNPDCSNCQLSNYCPSFNNFNKSAN